MSAAHSLLIPLFLMTGTASGQAGEPGFRDEFKADNRAAYQVKGAVAWARGAVTLGPGARLQRAVRLGGQADLRAVVRWPDKQDGAVAVRLAGPGASTLVGLVRVAGKTSLYHPHFRDKLLPLGPPQGAAAWSVRLHVSYGLAHAKAWPLGTQEPPEWHAVRFTGSFWEPRLASVQGGTSHGGVFESLEVRGIAPLGLTAEQDALLKKATELIHEAGALGERRAFEAALAKERAALALNRKLLPAGDPYIASGLTNIGLWLHHLGRHEEARALQEEALARARKHLPPRHPGIASILTNLGLVFNSLGKPERARELYAEGLAIRRQVLAADSPEVLNSLQNLAAVSYRLAHVGDSQAFAAEAVALLRKGKPPPGQLADMLDVLGKALHAGDRYEEALRASEEALALRRQEGATPAVLVELLAGVGTLYREVGRADRAAAHLEEAVALARKAVPKTEPATEHAVRRLAQLYHAQGRLDEARPLCEEALAWCRKYRPADHLRLGQSLNDLGALLYSLGQHREARALLEEARAVGRKALPPHHPEQASTLSNLAAVLSAQGDHEGARRLLAECAAILRQGQPPVPARLAFTLSHLGLALKELRRPAEALAVLEEALTLRQKTLPPFHLQIGQALNNVGITLVVLGRLDEAHARLEQALTVLKKAVPGQHRDLAVTRGNLAILKARQGRPDDAWALLREAVAGHSGGLARLSAGTAWRQHAALLGHKHYFLDMLLSLAEDAAPLTDARRGELFAAVLDSKDVSKTALAARAEALALDKDEAAHTPHAELKKVRQQLADLLLRAGPDSAGRAAELERREEELERELGGRVRAYAAARQARRAGVVELAERLGAGGVLIELVRFRRFAFTDRTPEGPRYAALLLAREDGRASIRFVPLGAAGALDDAVHAWRAAVQEGTTDARAEGVLRERLWDPLARALPKTAKRLVVAADGELVLVPFEALRVEGGRYLIEQMQVSYVSSARDLLRVLPEGKSAHALIVADPDYEAGVGGAEVAAGAGAGQLRGEDWVRAGLRFRRLPGFAREADAVARLLEGRGGWRVSSARGAEATEEAVGRAVRPRLLYLVTHGFFLRDADQATAPTVLRELELAGAGPGQRLPPAGDPRLRSGLALAGANQWQARAAKGFSDGLLTALEVENLDLWGTELVVLSACETGLGKVQVGEGVLGLRRAFQLAGAQTVVASLWKVPDAETERLMTNFLGRWLEGEGKADALRAAQLEMIRTLRASLSAARREAPPLYWAGFICHGRDK